jgi:hypothetical protein
MMLLRFVIRGSSGVVGRLQSDSPSPGQNSRFPGDSGSSRSSSTEIVHLTREARHPPFTTRRGCGGGRPTPRADSSPAAGPRRPR